MTVGVLGGKKNLLAEVRMWSAWGTFTIKPRLHATCWFRFGDPKRIKKFEIRRRCPVEQLAASILKSTKTPHMSEKKLAPFFDVSTVCLFKSRNEQPDVQPRVLRRFEELPAVSHVKIVSKDHQALQCRLYL